MPAATPPTAAPISRPTTGNHGTIRACGTASRHADRHAGQELDRAERGRAGTAFTAEPLAERRHLDDRRAGHPHERHGSHRAAALPQPHAEVEQRLHAERDRARVGGRARPSVPDETVIERIRPGGDQRQHRGGRDVAIEQHRDRSQTGGDARRRHRCQLGATDFAHELDRIGDAGDPRGRSVDRGALRPRPSSSTPVPRPTQSPASPPRMA